MSSLIKCGDAEGEIGRQTEEEPYEKVVSRHAKPCLSRVYSIFSAAECTFTDAERTFTVGEYTIAADD